MNIKEIRTSVRKLLWYAIYRKASSYKDSDNGSLVWQALVIADEKKGSTSFCREFLKHYYTVKAIANPEDYFPQETYSEMFDNTDEETLIKWSRDVARQFLKDTFSIYFDENF